MGRHRSLPLTLREWFVAGSLATTVPHNDDLRRIFGGAHHATRIGGVALAYHGESTRRSSFASLSHVPVECGGTGSTEMEPTHRDPDSPDAGFPFVPFCTPREPGKEAPPPSSPSSPSSPPPPVYSAEKLNVHIVAHTHDDVGWLKTVDDTAAAFRQT